MNYFFKKNIYASKKSIGLAILVLIVISGFLYSIIQDNTIINSYHEAIVPGDTLPESVASELPIEQVISHSLGELDMTQSIHEKVNEARIQNGLIPLQKNQALKNAAYLKAQDMNQKKYFSHITPEGKNISWFSDISGYQFTRISENLALGNFINSDEIVQAWLGSESHRNNILNSEVTESGIVVLPVQWPGIQGQALLIVHFFGHPISACPKVNTQLLVQKNRIESLIQEAQNQLRNRGNTQENQLSEEYYTKVLQEYSNLLNSLKTIITTYNNQLDRYQQCIQPE